MPVTASKGRKIPRMAAPRRIFTDKTEIVFMVPTKNKVVRKSLTAKEIVRIQFDKCKENILGIIPRDSESITIVSGKLGSPIVYKKFENKKFFNAYKTELEKFTKDNKVSFTNNLND